MSNWKSVANWVGAVAAALLIVILAEQLQAARLNYLKERSTARLPHAGMWVNPVTAILANGDSVVLANPRSRQVLLLLQSNCEFCRKSLPAWNSLADSVRVKSKGVVQVVGVQLDTLVPASTYASEHGLHFQVARFRSSRDGNTFAARATPFIVVVDTSGRIDYARPRTLDSEKALDSVISVALNGPSRLPLRK